MGRDVLLPKRHQVLDLFTVNIFDGRFAAKDDMASMEHPIFSLSTKKDERNLRYEYGDHVIEIKPTTDGLPNQHDKDILLYAMSVLAHDIKHGREPSKTIRFYARGMLLATNRNTGGVEYRRLRASLERLHGVSIQTNIKTGNRKQASGFHLIEEYHIHENPRNPDRMIDLEITLCDWLYNAVVSKEILSIDPDYFRLRKPLEKRIYELARKHVGDQKSWKIGLEKLHQKAGSTSPLRKFRFMVKQIFETNHLPEYYIVGIDDDVIEFRPRDNRGLQSNRQKSEACLKRPHLKPQTYENARKVAKGFDVHMLEEEWIYHWNKNGRIELDTPDGAFINFCKVYVEEHRGSATYS